MKRTLEATADEPARAPQARQEGLDSLTSRRQEMKIAETADYFVTPAPIPSSVAVFSCPCGATAAEFDATEIAPPDWSTADDGSHRCPVCTVEASSREQ